MLMIIIGAHLAMQPTLTASGLNIYSRKNLHKTKDGAYVNILHKYKLIKTH